MTRSEEYLNEPYDDHGALVQDDSLDAQESLNWSIVGNPHCIVLTQDKGHADYIVNILALHYPKNFLGNWADARLVIKRANGDVLLMHTLFQGERNPSEDITQQAIVKTWDYFCEKQK